MTRALASHSRSCWFWQTNLSRNNDGPVVLDGDDETNGMCPIIGSGRDVHTVGFKYPEAFNVVRSPLPPPLLSLFHSLHPVGSPFAYSSVCARICLFARIFNMPFARTRIYEFTFDSETGRKLASIKSSIYLGRARGKFHTDRDNNARIPTFHNIGAIYNSMLSFI